LEIEPKPNKPYDCIKSELGLVVTRHFLSFVIIAFLLTGSSVLLVVDAYAVSLYKQVQNRTEGQILYCNNPDHLLVLRASLKFACVYPETAIKKSWHPAVFNDNGNVTVSGSVTVWAHEKDHRISYAVIEGLLNGMRYHPDWNALWLEIHSQSRGGMELSIPKQFFEQGDFFIVLENDEEVAFASLQDEHSYLLQFNFTHPDPVIEVIRASLP